MNFADNLKRICTERGTSPTALLKSMGVATSKVAMWNSGSLPKQEMLIRLAKELNCSVMDFFADDADLAAQNSSKTNADAEPKNEDESDILRIFRSLSRRAKHEFMSMVYEFETHEECLRICERNRGHGISRDLSSVLLHFWDFKHIPYMDDRSRDAVRVSNHRPFRSGAVEFLRDTPETIPLVNSMGFKSIIGF